MYAKAKGISKKENTSFCQKNKNLFSRIFLNKNTFGVGGGFDYHPHPCMTPLIYDPQGDSPGPRRGGRSFKQWGGGYLGGFWGGVHFLGFETHS